ncbi:MAG: hypothetical protein LKG11_03910 [Bacilli bacterium]|jgi:hypothetical protein|nr:hypothetical protein [Bacilli bacterium]
MRRFKFTKNVAATMMMALLTIASLAVSTFAWFNVKSGTNIAFWSMKISDPSNVKVQIKYCVYNKTTTYDADGKPVATFAGYNDPRPPTTTDPRQRKTCVDYSSDFISVPGNVYKENGPLDMKNLVPGVVHTFVFEIYAAKTTSVRFYCRNWYSPGNGVCYLAGPHAYPVPVCLASAIDMYPNNYPKGTNAENTAHAAQYMTTYICEWNGRDYFTFYDNTQQLDPNGYLMWSGTIEGDHTNLVFFTLGFSNKSDCYYKYSSTDGTHDYYYRDSNGSNDCYRGMEFNITDLYIDSVQSS